MSHRDVGGQDPAVPHQRRVGHYELLGEIGQGGMGVVYRARDLKLGRLVALKRPSPRRAGEARLHRRFLREARAAARLSHPSIVPIYEVFEEDGTPWLAMQLVDGGSLRETLDAGRPLPLREILQYAAQLAEALQEAHENRILHRDIKPGNVILAGRGDQKRAMLADFGLARFFTPPEAVSAASTASAASTPTGVVVGTTGYMSPEQSLGQEVDERSDIFSLGTVLYEMCTGRPAFGGTTVGDALDAVLNRDPAPIARLNYGIPEALERLVRKCLSKQPDERYQDTRDLLVDLRAVSRRVEHESYSKEHPEPHPPAIRSRVRWSAAGAAILVVAFVLWRLTRTEKAPGPHTLAVATFQNVEGDPKLGYLCRGLTGTLIARLAGLQGIYVTPAEKDMSGDLILEGEVQKSGDTVRITYHLHDQRSHRTFGGDAVQGGVEQLFVLQDAVAQGVASALRGALGLPVTYVAARPPTQDIAGFDLYLQGRDDLSRIDEPASLDLAVDLLQRSVSRDAGFALAHAALGEAYWKKYERSHEAAWVARARDSCDRAIRLDPSLAVAQVCAGTVHTGLGLYQQAALDFMNAIRLDATNDAAYRGLGRAHEALGNPADAERAFKQAIELHRTYWAAYSLLGAFYFRQGRYGDAEAQYRTVIALAPNNESAFRSLGGIYHEMGRYEEAIAELQNAIRIRPTYQALGNLGGNYFSLHRFTEAADVYEKAVRLPDADYACYGSLARALYWAPGRRREAPAVFEQAIRLGKARLEVNPHDSDVQMMLAYYQAMLGDRGEALEWMGKALSSGPDNAESRFWAGLIYQQLGDKEEALAAIERSVSLGYSTAEIRSAAELEGLRGNPRFTAVLEKG